jgi:hypothetical protein
VLITAGVNDSGSGTPASWAVAEAGDVGEEDVADDIGDDIAEDVMDDMGVVIGVIGEFPLAPAAVRVPAAPVAAGDAAPLAGCAVCCPIGAFGGRTQRMKSA